MKTIRLLLPIRVGKEIFPNNAVFDAADDVAEDLLGHNPPCAEETDAIERYPIGNPLNHVDDYPVHGGEKFPLPEGEESIVAAGKFKNHADRLVERRLQAVEPPAATVSKEPAPAKVEVTAEMKQAEKDEPARKAAEAATPVVVAPAVKPVVAPTPTPTVVTPAAKDKA
jgi:hypothetical protein